MTGIMKILRTLVLQDRSKTKGLGAVNYYANGSQQKSKLLCSASAACGRLNKNQARHQEHVPTWHSSGLTPTVCYFLEPNYGAVNQNRKVQDLKGK